MITSISTNIDGYSVELVLSHCEPATDCFIGYRKDRYTATLSAAQHAGILYDNRDNEHVISGHTLERIEAWALENGY